MLPCNGMRFTADLHIHSRFSRACSKQLTPEALHLRSQLKGVGVPATGDFTHPAWFAELRRGLSRLNPGPGGSRPLAARVDREVPAKCRAPVRFLLAVEVSCIYKKAGRVRKAHHLVYAPDFEAAGRINSALGRIGNIRSDGRPILGLDSRDLLEIVLEAGEDCHLVPAHAWTPHFSVFGSQSGFDSLEECFGDLAPRIFAIETGLSSDPPMNRRVSGLDRLALLSNSDAHSPQKIAREANVFDAELSYRGIFDAIRAKDRSRRLRTLEFFPEEGKYHADGHRACGVRLLPAQTLRRKGLCPICRKPVTVGVLHRVERLADRGAASVPKGMGEHEYIVPLKEVLGQTLQVGPSSLRVDALYRRMLARFGSELTLLRETPIELLEREGFPLVALALSRMRRGRVRAEAGYDGRFGTVALLAEKDFQCAAAS